VKKLDELGCPSWVRSEEGRTPVHVAAEQGWVALIDLLVRELRNKVDSRDAYQFTPLHSAANGGHVGTIQKLIHFSHDVDVRDYLGTPSHPQICLAAFCLMFTVSLPQNSIHAIACQPAACIHGGCLQHTLVHQRGPSPNMCNQQQSLKQAAQVTYTCADVIKFTVWGRHWQTSHLCDTNLYRTKQHLASAGRTPLHYAALHGRAAAVEELIKQGAAHGAKDNRGGYTPLHLAADAGQCEVISRLFELGADLEAVSIKGWTPLALANMKVSWHTISTLSASQLRIKPPVHAAQGSASSNLQHVQATRSCATTAVVQHRQRCPALDGSHTAHTICSVHVN